LADVLARVRTLVSDDLVTAHEVAEQLAPVRATSRVLAVLPVTGVLLGAGLGVNVVSLLLTTMWGQVCLVGAVTLVAGGLWVIDRISERARSLR
jgi:tight adherence protein B